MEFEAGRGRYIVAQRNIKVIKLICLTLPCTLSLGWGGVGGCQLLSDEKIPYGKSVSSVWTLLAGVW